MVRYDANGNPIQSAQELIDDSGPSAQDLIDQVPKKKSTWTNVKEFVMGSPKPQREMPQRRVVVREPVYRPTAEDLVREANQGDRGQVQRVNVIRREKAYMPSAEELADKANVAAEVENYRAFKTAQAQERLSSKAMAERQQAMNDIMQGRVEEQDAKDYALKQYQRWEKPIRDTRLKYRQTVGTYVERPLSKIQGAAAGVLRGARRFEANKEVRTARSAGAGFANFLFPMVSVSGGAGPKGKKGTSYVRRGVPGRPRGVYTYISPITGKPAHIYQVRADRRKVKNIQNQRQMYRQMQLAQAMMRRGLPAQMAYEQAQRLQALREEQALKESYAAQERAQSEPQMPQQQAQMQQAQMPQRQQRMQPQPQQAAQAPPTAQIIRPVWNPFQSNKNNIFMGKMPNQQPVRQGYYPQQGYQQQYKEEKSFFNSNVTKLVPKEEKSEKWANDRAEVRPGQMGMRRPQPGGYYQ